MPFELAATEGGADNDEDTSSSATTRTVINLMKQRLSGLETEHGRLQGLSYEPHSKDEVVITTTPKSGTTWMQQICHQLRSAAPDGGDMNFDEISRVVPWLELAYDLNQDLDAPQYGGDDNKPRFFKSHAWEEHCPQFQKTIVVIRHPNDVVVSFYKFFEDWFFEPGSISMDDFAEEFWLARGVPPSKMQNASYFVHLVSWYKRLLQQQQQHKNDDDGGGDCSRVLFVCFEDLKDDLEGQVRRVARFVSTDKVSQLDC
jgi:Sulfotransferase domain